MASFNDRYGPAWQAFKSGTSMSDYAQGTDDEGGSYRSQFHLMEGLHAKGQSMIHDSFPSQGNTQPSYMGSQSVSPTKDYQ